MKRSEVPDPCQDCIGMAEHGCFCLAMADDDPPEHVKTVVLPETYDRPGVTMVHTTKIDNESVPGFYTKEGEMKAVEQDFLKAEEPATSMYHPHHPLHHLLWFYDWADWDQMEETMKDWVT